MSTKLSPIVQVANATGAESGAPAGGDGKECLEWATQAYWYIGLPAPADTATLEVWLYNPTRSKWYKSSDSAINITGDSVVLVNVNGEGGRTFVQVTAASTFPVTRDVQFIEKDA